MPAFLLMSVIAALAAFGAIVGGGSRTLETPSFTIHITEQCEVDEVGCDRVIYQSVSKAGRTITLHGKERMQLCADGKTPCVLLGWEFTNKDFLYLVDIDGTLSVEQNQKTILTEHGKWTDE